MIVCVYGEGVKGCTKEGREDKDEAEKRERNRESM